MQKEGLLQDIKLIEKKSYNINYPINRSRYLLFIMSLLIGFCYDEVAFINDRLSSMLIFLLL